MSDDIKLPEMPDIAPSDDWDSVLDCVKDYARAAVLADREGREQVFTVDIVCKADGQAFNGVFFGSPAFKPVGYLHPSDLQILIDDPECSARLVSPRQAPGDVALYAPVVKGAG